MRIVNVLAGALLAATTLVAQRGADQEQLRAQRAEKLQKPFLQKARWHTDYDKARAQAKAQGRVLFTYFTRSYAP
jgi:hypothetical protein